MNLRPNISRVTIPPVSNPVNLGAVKRRLRMDEGDDLDDDDIESMVREMTEFLEGETGRAFITQTVVATFDQIEAGDILELPRPRLIDVLELKIYDEENTAIVIDPSMYQIDRWNEPARVIINDEFEEKQREYSAVEITYTAGYGSSPESIPEVLQSAIKELVFYKYENRDAVLTGSIVAQMPINWERITNRFKVFYL